MPQTRFCDKFAVRVDCRDQTTMNPAHETLEQLFDRFRRTRDAACLGRVFDRCADELFAVALHVCPDRATAEDVLQATFLTAIERASRYATTRPLVPWLLGILHREAKRARRRARRAPDPARLGRNAATAPPQLLVAEEARSEVGAAIAQMPQPYRDVLELHLVQALPAGAIAAQLSRSPGAVRTQLWRGLERLRRLLPPGLALGGAGALASRPVLAAVRERIVRSAHVAVPTTAGIGTSLILGGIMLKQVLIAVGVVTAIVFVWWQGATVDLLPDPEPVASSAAPQAAGGLAAAPPPTERGAADRSSVAAASAAPPPTDAAGAPAAPPAVMLGILAVDAAGEPVADAEVRVFEERDRRRGIELWRGRSDAAGRCRAFVADSVLVSARKTGVGWSGDVAVRAHGAGAEVRAVILPTATIHGVVLDATGEPASGALVTCHASDFEAGLRPEPPPARTREDGTFEVEVLPRHEYRVHAQVGDRHARPVTVSALAADARQEVTLRVPGAFSVRGRLENATGAPLAKGQIRLLRRDTSPAERTRRAETDADGRF
ncbi:MAG: sigma-70 family RNA polymerase sigma factor, partial [Planctomycetes bacterium]|nr:sigma-70 family RNA polymerase sigma factor [Planctomycetota bacterium]